MLYQNNECRFSIAIFGRGKCGKSSFLQCFLDRGDVHIKEIFENEDYSKIVYEVKNFAVIDLYKFNALPNNPAIIEEFKYEYTSLFSKLDYMLYMVSSIKAINEFDRRFIRILNETETQIFCVFNKLVKEDVNQVQVYIEQGILGVPAYLCNCVNRIDVMTISETLDSYLHQDYDFFQAIQFLRETPRTVLFLMPFQISSHSKNMEAKHFELVKTVVGSNGIALCLNREALPVYLENFKIQPDVMIAGDKILLNVEDFSKFIT